MKSSSLAFAAALLQVGSTPSWGVAGTVIKYGNSVYLQNNHKDSKWLSDRDSVITRDLYKNDYERDDARWTYKWKVRSNPHFSNTDGKDNKTGQCVKFGDPIYLESIENEYSLLSGSRGEGNEGAVTRDINQSNYELGMRDAYEWVIRSNLGTGGNDKDPAKGVCIQENSMVYLQNMGMPNRWLSGSRGAGNEGVLTRNALQSTYEKVDAKDTYLWIISKTLSNGSRSQGLTCPVTDAGAGRWRSLEYVNTPEYTVTWWEGNSRSSETTTTNEVAWEASVAASVSADFMFGEASLEVSATYGEVMSSSVSSALTAEKGSERSAVFDEGQLWQFVYDVEDSCYPSSWTIETYNVVQTENMTEKPCCLPGYAKYHDRQHGPCVDDSPCDCDDSVCNDEGRRLNNNLRHS